MNLLRETEEMRTIKGKEEDFNFTHEWIGQQSRFKGIEKTHGQIGLSNATCHIAMSALGTRTKNEKLADEG
jgi:hypothetical protein